MRLLWLVEHPQAYSRNLYVSIISQNIIICVRHVGPPASGRQISLAKDPPTQRLRSTSTQGGLESRRGILVPVKIVMGSDQLWDELHEVLKHRHIAIGDDALASVNRLLRKNERVKQTVSSLQLRPERAGIAEEYWELAKLISLMTPSFGFCLGINKWSPF